MRDDVAEPRVAVLAARVRRREVEVVRRAAEYSGLDLSEWLRQVAFTAAAEQLSGTRTVSAGERLTNAERLIAPLAGAGG